MPALDRLAVREISARFLSQDERIEIADLRHAGLSIRQIAGRLGRAPSTISRELRRNATASGLPAVRGAPPGDRAAGPPSPAAHRDQRELGQLVAELLAQRWSPQQISRQLRLRFPGQPEMWLCHESIYQAIYQPGSPLMRPSPLAPHRRSPLRTGRDHRRAHQHAERRRPRFEQPMLTIASGPSSLRTAPQAGHWEGDLIIGKDQGSAISAEVMRQYEAAHEPTR